MITIRCKNNDATREFVPGTTLQEVFESLALDMPYGAGGITWKDDRFYVVGGLPPTQRCNYVHEYDTDFNLVRRHVLNTEYTVLGIQTAAFLDPEKGTIARRLTWFRQYQEKNDL